mmetsp:Transcript_44594/g.69759  ORF Transcript_44594/g.69759 Transcript_44594/m.69759 type:complete len:247 (-) Transcript_44594:70-810(-)|eukprot:CAMPEP_0184296388 /NCGR_PEP_ID=MMETSP1049-20130417/7368_1 /TAXON_ID=77928 /ORGANISM="Proteomonas sulcata, Strain CCMP704" /LENGTH=246 /DNA_ID=CAMNT_0026605599 /DNA_START=151 /DNA_END=891 /DNA_ORIENTATION=+
MQGRGLALLWVAVVFLSLLPLSASFALPVSGFVESRAASPGQKLSNAGEPKIAPSRQHKVGSAGLRMAGELVPLEPLPPSLSAPVFSLATINDDGSTNMNILTYAVPVGMKPHRRWIISLFQGTLSHENFQKRRKGVLQLLRKRHAPLIEVLGKQGGKEIDKRSACKELGFEWSQSMGPEAPLLLSQCAAYYPLKMEGEFWNAGEHDATMCEMEGIFVEKGAPEIEVRGGEDEAMYTLWLRDEGLI